MRNRRRRPLSWYIIWFVILFFLIAVVLSVIISLPAWRIKNISISGANIIALKHVEKMAAPLIGENIFLADYSVLQGKLHGVRQLKDFGIFRKLPSTVVVKLIERKPFAVVIISGSSIIIDDEGRFLDVKGGRLESGDYSFVSTGNISDLPVIRGFVFSDVENGALREDSSSAIRITVSELTRFLPQSKLQLEMNRGGDMNLLVEDVLKVRFGRTSDVEAKLAVLEAMLPVVRDRWGDIEYIDIRVSTNPVIKYKNT